MRPTLRHRLVNLLHSALLLVGMAVIGWVSMTMITSAWIAGAVVLGLIAGMLLAPSTPRRLLLSFYAARPLDERAFPEGVALLRTLAERAGLPRRPELFYIPSAAPNAFAIGNPGDSTICISDGLLRLLDRREFAGVLAHEVSHVANRDLWIMGLADIMTRATSLVSYIGQFILLVNLPLLLVGAVTVPWALPLILIFAPTIMSLLQLALSRAREFDADLGAVRLTGDPEGLASALLKLERRLGRFWEDIFLPGRRMPEPSLLRTHPPTEERVARLRALAKSEDGPRHPARPRPSSIPASISPVHHTPRLRWTGVWY